MSTLEDHAIPESKTFWKQFNLALNRQRFLVGMLLFNIFMSFLPYSKPGMMKVTIVVLGLVAISSTIFAELFKQDGRDAQSLLNTSCKLLDSMDTWNQKLVKENNELKEKMKGAA